MPQQNGDVGILELRQQIQQAFYGLAGLTSDKAQRKAIRTVIKGFVKAQRLVIRGQQGEVVDAQHHDRLIDEALDEAEDFDSGTPPEV